jgi:RNA polymerase sigma-70 factor (ECF subfamily)
MAFGLSLRFPLWTFFSALFARGGNAGNTDRGPGSAVLEGDSPCEEPVTSGAKMSPDEISAMAEEVLNTMGDAILRLAFSYLHNREDAEDILQETMIKLVTQTPVFENEKHRKAWLMTVAANLSKNRIEYNKVRDTAELNEELAGAEEEDRNVSDDLSAIWKAVEQLPVNQREAIHLFYQEGYKTAEIAEITGRPEATVRSDLKRGRDKLKSILKEADDFE